MLINQARCLALMHLYNVMILLIDIKMPTTVSVTFEIFLRILFLRIEL